MLSPHAVRRREVVYPCQVLELIHWRLLARDPELVFEFPRRSDAHPQLLPLHLFLLKVIEWVGATRIRPHIREGDLLGRAPLQQKLAIGRTEDKGGECAM